jgi:integrase
MLVRQAVENYLAGQGGRWGTEQAGRSKPLLAAFGARLVVDVSAADIAVYQRRRAASGLAARTVNMEIGVLRGALKPLGIWAQLADHVSQLRERADVGRAISDAEEEALLAACRASKSPSLYPAFVLSLHSGLRRGELRRLRGRDLRLEWCAGAIVSGELTVAQAKTEAGEGRTVPLSQAACVALTAWLPYFPGRKPESFVFPAYRLGAGDEVTRLWDLDLSRPMGSFAKAWGAARRKAKVNCRWHDLRHTFVSRLLENAEVSEATVKALAGHVSQRMLERYGHIRSEAKRDAIAAVERRKPTGGTESAQKTAQSAKTAKGRKA